MASHRSARSTAIDAFPRLAERQKEFDIYENLIVRWQRKINLVSKSTVKDLWWRHFANSVQLVDLAPKANRWVDLGSGAGFPGLVIALALKGTAGCVVNLVKSDLRKAAFLREVSRETSAPVVVHPDRAENVIAKLSTVEVVTSRAMASVPKLMATLGHLFEANTTGLFLVGKTAVPELTSAIEASTFELRSFPSRTSDGSVISVRRMPSKADV